METVLITGGTGMIGSALAKALLAKGYKVVIFTRHPKPSQDNRIFYKEWNIAAGTIDKRAVEEADYVVHLAGANVAEKRWTAARKKEIADSRTKSGALLIKSLKETPNKIRAVISASAIGWYGADAQVPNLEPFVETDKADDSFLGHTCELWEEAIQPVSGAAKRLVILRIGIVLSNEGGAYAEFKKPLKFGAAAILGTGSQVISWIQIDDLVNLFVTAIENEALKGVYNAVAPKPVTNRELIMEMAKLRGTFYIPFHVPRFALQLALGEMSIEVLKSATVSSAKLEATGFKFMHPTIQEALKKLRAPQEIPDN